MDGEGVTLQPEPQIFFWKKNPCKISHFLPRLDKWLHSCFPFKQSSLWTWACRGAHFIIKESELCVLGSWGTHAHPPISTSSMETMRVGKGRRALHQGGLCRAVSRMSSSLPDLACDEAWQTYLLARKYKHVSQLPNQWTFFLVKD